jgi:hypothetical protein
MSALLAPSRLATTFLSGDAVQMHILKTGFVNGLFCAAVPVAIAHKESGQRREEILCECGYPALCTRIASHNICLCNGFTCHTLQRIVVVSNVSGLPFLPHTH